MTGSAETLPFEALVLPESGLSPPDAQRRVEQVLTTLGATYGYTGSSSS
jgi:hypothetical protein